MVSNCSNNNLLFSTKKTHGKVCDYKKSCQALELRRGRNFSARPGPFALRLRPARPVSLIAATLDPTSISEDSV
jgi:hypothetical protein